MGNTYKKGVCFFLLSFLLTGCMSSPLQQEVDEAKKREQTREEIDHPNVEYAEDLKDNRPAEELLEEEEKDFVEVDIADYDFMEQEEFENPREFSHFLSETLLHFRTLDITPEEMIDFIYVYGSDSYVEGIHNNHVSIQLFNEIQQVYKENPLDIIEQKVSVLDFNDRENQATFFRQITSYHDDPEYYRTTIVSKDGVWKYEDNRQSVNTEFIDAYSINEEQEGNQIDEGAGDQQ